MAGLRFGDQVLQINGANMAGYSSDKAMEVIKKATPQRIVMAVRDRYGFVMTFVLTVRLFSGLEQQGF